MVLDPSDRSVRSICPTELFHPFSTARSGRRRDLVCDHGLGRALAGLDRAM